MTEHVRLTRILVPIDPEDPSDAALVWAADLARHFSAEVVLMVANETLGVVPASEHARRAADEIARRLAPEVERLARADVPSRIAPFPIRPPRDEADTIVEAATELAADLIIIETHGRRGLARLAHLGSASERVARAAPCPVLVLRHHATPEP